MALDYRTLYLIADNLADLYEDGIPIVLSLELLSELPISREYKKSLVDIKNRVNEGKTLASSFDENKKLYPELFSGIVGIGEGSGKLVLVLKSLKEFYFHLDILKSKVINAIRYPLIVFSALIFLIIAFVLFIIPRLYETFNSISKEVSPIIVFCYKLSQYIKNNKIYSVIILISAFFVILLSYKYIKTNNSEKKNKILFKLKILRQYYEYIFIMILSIIISSGIEISKGVDLCVKAIEIKTIKQAMRKFREDILSGVQMADALKKVGFLSDYSLSMIMIGEQSGSMEEILKKVSRRLEDNLLQRLEKIVSYVMPVSIIVVSFMILIFIAAFISPMLDIMYSGVE